MKPLRSSIVLFLVCLLWCAASGFESKAGGPVYPLRVSDNHRYFVDQQGKPVFWLGTTQWQLFREYKLEDARLIVEKTKGKGFAFAQVMLLGVGEGTKPNVDGQKPWLDDNPLTPNEGYFTHVDAVVQIARQNNLVISMTMFSVNMSKLAASEVRAFWLDPRAGESKPAGRLSNSGVQSFSTPEGWEDALLVLE